MTSDEQRWDVRWLQCRNTGEFQPIIVECPDGQYATYEQARAAQAECMELLDDE